MTSRDDRFWGRCALVGIFDFELDPAYWQWKNENPEAYDEWLTAADAWIDRVLEVGHAKAGEIPTPWERFREDSDDE